jgi:hypothetical protein
MMDHCNNFLWKDICLCAVAVSADGDLLKLGNPDRHDAVALEGGGEVVAVFRSENLRTRVELY